VFLEGRLVEVRRDLEIAEQNFSEFASKNTAINIEKHSNSDQPAGYSARHGRGFLPGLSVAIHRPK
jgi:hypothetical protein